LADIDKTSKFVSQLPKRLNSPIQHGIAAFPAKVSYIVRSSRLSPSPRMGLSGTGKAKAAFGK